MLKVMLAQSIKAYMLNLELWASSLPLCLCLLSGRGEIQAYGLLLKIIPSSILDMVPSSCTGNVTARVAWVSL